ncbi:MAG: hypothetical protein QOJ91_217 [Sphingomonadales bacterium]|nr:hypothetical protein [Sphingomonadales bacterium]
MRLARYVSSFVSDWRAALARGIPSEGEPLPYWAVGAFTPSEKDKGQLSLFAIDENVSPQGIAAALAFNRQKVDAHLFVTAQAEELEALQLKLSKSPGDTDHPIVNDRHYVLELHSLDQIRDAARSFLNGGMEFVDIKEINSQLRSDARGDAIDWLNLATSAHENAWKKAMSFIRDKTAEVRGIAA